jgi:hypothetical protein
VLGAFLFAFVYDSHACSASSRDEKDLKQFPLLLYGNPFILQISQHISLEKQHKTFLEACSVSKIKKWRRLSAKQHNRQYYKHIEMAKPSRYLTDKRNHMNILRCNLCCCHIQLLPNYQNLQLKISSFKIKKSCERYANQHQK